MAASAARGSHPARPGPLSGRWARGSTLPKRIVSVVVITVPRARSADATPRRVRREVLSLATRELLSRAGPKVEGLKVCV